MQTAIDEELNSVLDLLSYRTYTSKSTIIYRVLRNHFFDEDGKLRDMSLDGVNIRDIVNDYDE